MLFNIGISAVHSVRTGCQGEGTTFGICEIPGMSDSGPDGAREPHQVYALRYFPVTASICAIVASRSGVTRPLSACSSA